MTRISYIFFALLMLNASFKVGAQTTTKPNIVILLSDDHGAGDTGFAGNKDVLTPVMDHLASEGMVFTRAFAPASVCAPSRSSIYTGLYPHSHGCHQNHGSIKSNIETLPSYLSKLGYTVALAGKVHVAPVTSFPFEFIERHEIPAFLTSAKTEPFCLIVAFNSPHEPYFNKKNGIPYRQIQPKEWLPDTPETRMLTAAYYDNVENLDNEIGSTMYWLQISGLSKNSLIFYTSDHGPGLPFGKWTLYEKALHVPLIVKWDNVIPPGTINHSMVSLIDILPTLLEIAGLKLPQNLNGTSLLPLLTGSEKNLHEYIFGAYTNIGVIGGNRYPIRSVRNNRYKLIVNFNHEESFTIRMIQQPDERAIICGFRVLESWRTAASEDPFAAQRLERFRNRAKIELYDLKDDPYELKNLADNPDVLSIQGTLMNELKKWMAEQADKILEEI